MTGAAAASEEGGFKPAFINSLSMILVSEMGDETFIIAAIMAMRHPRFIVLAGEGRVHTFNHHHHHSVPSRSPASLSLSLSSSSSRAFNFGC